MTLAMDKTRTYISLFCLLYLLSIACCIDIKTEVGPILYEDYVKLKCILLPPNTAEKVTWTKVVGDNEITLATYPPDSRAEISEGYKDRVWMSTSGLNETSITISKANIQDEGCYRCHFSSSTTGSKNGEDCFSFPGEVLVKKHHKVELFQPVTLTCIKRKKAKVVQISWKKDNVNIATYTEDVNINPGYEGIINVTTEDGDLKTSLTLFTANISSDGKYSCVFNVFPGGSVTGEMSLQVYAPLNVTVSKNQVSGPLTITCVARSWPPSTISWLDVDEGSLNCTTYDGLQTVTSWIQIDSQQKKMPKCKVLHQGEESLFHVSTGARCRLHPLIICLLLSKMLFL